MNYLSNIKPIETKYAGHLFRSRLEARWAKFFDVLEITWAYEQEGYDLGSVGYYLPDFVLPGVYYRTTLLTGWIAEVKPVTAFNIKLDTLCVQLQKPGILLGAEKVKQSGYEQHGDFADYDMGFLKCESCGTNKIDWETKYIDCQCCGGYMSEVPAINAANIANSIRF